MRLEAEQRTWTLPPARAALIGAGKPVTVTLQSDLQASSVLFHQDFVPPPHAPLAVFEMTPLSRELVRECQQWGPDAGELSAYASSVFFTLAQVVWRLSEQPSPASMPQGHSLIVQRALDYSERNLANDLDVKRVAASVATTPRSLARHFADEIGMTWSEAVRRQRMIRAIEALASTSASISAIAYAVGYNSLSAFNSAFRAFAGQSPSAYRRSIRNSQK